MEKIRIYLKKLYAFLHQMPGWVWLIPILILAINVRLTYLTKADIWHDEGYTAAIIQQPIREIIAITTTDVHPPLYYVIMHVWQSIFGNSVASLRGFSVTCGVLTIALLFLLLQKLFSKRIAIFGDI
jgi:mannosyltransferase